MNEFNQAQAAFNLVLRRSVPYLIVLVALVFLCNAGAYLTHSLWFQQAQSKIERQNLNVDPNYARQVTLDFATTYADFQASHNKLAPDVRAAQQFVTIHGKDIAKWSLSDKQLYNHLEAIAEGDYQNEQSLAAHWASLVGNPDKARYLSEVSCDNGPGSCPQVLNVADTDPATVLPPPVPLY